MTDALMLFPTLGPAKILVIASVVTVLLFIITGITRSNLFLHNRDCFGLQTRPRNDGFFEAFPLTHETLQ